MKFLCRSSSIVEQYFCKVKVAGANPVFGSLSPLTNAESMVD